MVSKRCKRFRKQSYKKSLKSAVDTGVPFSDSEFKPDDSSIATSIAYKSQLNVGKIIWKRPRELVDDPHFLFREKLGPNSQVEFVGTARNSWFLSACVATAQEKSLIYKVIPKDQFHFLNGIFKVNIWSYGVWLKIIVDDKLPTFDNRLVFSSSHSGCVFWVPILEKAYAKLHGSYEAMAARGSLQNALIDLTGAPVEESEIHVSDDEKDYFRLIVEELDKKSIICVQTKDKKEEIGQKSNLKPNSVYLITAVKKPSIGSFKKSIKESNASIKVVSTVYEEAESTRKGFTAEQLADQWMSIENFTKIFHHLIICHLKISQTKKESINKGSSETQFCFDVTQYDDEVLIELMQESSADYQKIGYKIFKVEMNRKFRFHNFNDMNPMFTSDELKIRSIFSRIKLNFGRYLLIPQSSTQDINLILRLYTQNNSNLRTLTMDMPKRSLLSVLSPKYPKFVTRVIVKGAHGLEKQDRFGSANPYCVLRCGRKAIKSAPVHDTLNPDWDNFSAIFYHGKFASIIIEVWHSSLLVDSFMGQVEILPKITNDDLNRIQDVELCARKKDQVRQGTIKFQVLTSEDLRCF